MLLILRKYESQYMPYHYVSMECNMPKRLLQTIICVFVSKIILKVFHFKL